jgi:AcrR family transcriptional regulator
MEAATTESARDLPGDKAQRIIEAMRASVASRGAARSTFDHVAREAGVSRGLLHYYFGTKERLLLEVVRRDADIRLTLLDKALAKATTAQAVIDALVRSLEYLIEHDPGFYALIFELFTVARRNEEIAAESSELARRTREHVANELAAKQREGVIELADDPEAVASLLLALGDGLALRMLIEPGADHSPGLRAAIRVAGTVITEPS